MLFYSEFYARILVPEWQQTQTKQRMLFTVSAHNLCEVTSQIENTHLVM